MEWSFFILIIKIYVNNNERFTYFRPFVRLSISSHIEEGFFISTLKEKPEQRVHAVMCCRSLWITV